MAAVAARSGACSPSSLVQDSVCRILKLPDPPKSPDAVRAAAFGIMKWVVIDRFRAGSARERRESCSAQIDSDSAEPHDHRTHLEDSLAELAALSPRCAEAFMLHVVANVPTVRIASMLGVTERTINRDLDFARKWIASRHQYL